MKKILLYTAIIALSLLAAWQITRAINLNGDDRSELDYYRSLDLTGIAHRSISDAFVGVPLGLEQIQLSDFKSDSLTLGDVVRAHSGPAIYCARISATGCHPCIAETMRRISEYKSSHPESTVVVFVANTPNRDLNVFGAQYGRKFEFFRADTFPLDFDDEITPYVFTLDTCGTIGNHEIISVR